VAQIRTRTGESARTVILRTATDLLRVEGPAGLTVTRVAAEVGVTKAAVYHHFQGRDNLRRAVFAPLLAEVEAVITGPAVRSERVEAFIALIGRHREVVELCLGHRSEAGGREPDGDDQGLDAELEELRHRVITALAPQDADPVRARLRVVMLLGACAAAVADPASDVESFRRLTPVLRGLVVD
jgi:AcrR family transcriptional regulator